MRKGKQAISVKPKKVTLNNFQIIEVNDNPNDNRSEFGYENENLNLYTDSNSSNKCSSGNIECKVQTYSLGRGYENLDVCTDSDSYINCIETKENKTNSKKSREIQKITQTYYSLQKTDLNQHTRIIRGDFHQGDGRFVELSRGKQCVAISIVALCFFKINNSPATWTTADINNILTTADIQYHASYQKMKREGKTPEAKHLSISDVYPFIKFGRQYFCFNGMKNVFDGLDYEKDVFNLINLERSLNRFFNENTNECGVFTCNNYSFAIIRKSNSFFLFNPYPTSYAGEPMNPNDNESAACLMEMFTIRCLANHLLEACSQEQETFDDSECDASICYSLTSLSIGKEVFGKDILKRRKVNRDLCKAECNRGGIKRKLKPELFEYAEDHINRRQKREHSETHTLLNQATMQNQNFLERTAFDRVNIIGDNKNSINNDYEFDNVSTNGHVATEVLIGCGLLNIGNSCFFNACFQAFFHIPIINVHLQKIRTKKCTCVVCNMITVFKDTHSRKDQQQCYNPSNLYRTLQKGNEDLLNGEQQDAHEFWMRLMNMENEGTCSTMFDRLFVHEVVTIVTCRICGSNSQTKRKFSGHVIEILGQLTIREAVEAYFAEEVIETYECSVCKKINRDTKKKHILENAPNILCLMLNRFSNDKKIEDDIVLNEQLKLSVSSETNLINYKLVSLINHFGTNIFNGHYTAVACRLSHSFSEFDDSRVHNINAVTGSNAYILLYELSTEIEIEDAYNSESKHAVRSQHDVQIFLSENESTPNLHDESENHNDTDTEAYCQEVQNESENHDEENNILSGRRIVDIGFLFEQMKYINRHSDTCDSQMVFRKETKLGFRSIFHFECADCGAFHQIQSSSKNDDYMNVNKAATLGFTSIGSGFYHMQELCAHLNIPSMSSSTFEVENKKLQIDWSELSKHHTEKALLEEIRLAIARGDVDSAGNALITVICDGSWGKRSYGKGFSSLSGCAAIIGLHTKKVLYFGVKNKYCHVCTLSYAKFCPPNDHVCNINYVGPSSGMETEILVEGFQFCELMGARFHKVISDGDSSAFKEITEQCIYQDPDILIEKLECVNHLYKNARKKFTALCSDTKFKLDYRKLLKHSMGDDLCKGIRSAAKHWRESNVDIIQKLENLERDCLNAPYHYFGNHDNCDQYFCTKNTTEESNTNIALLKSCGLFHEILSYCNSYFASNVRSLLEDQTNNPAEELNNVIAKYLGGKRINFSLAGSYTARVSASVVQYNSKGHAGSQFHEFHSINPNNYCLKIENCRKKHYAKNEAARQTKPRKKATRDKNVKGYKAQKEDLSERALEVAMNIELAKLDTNRINRDMILKLTFNQKHNLKWKEIRKKLINCNYFGRIINAKSPKSYQKLLEEMLNNPIESGNTAEVRHQRLYEPEALHIFSQIHNDFELKKTGIFIDKELSFLGASPLRLYGPDSIVNVKCPVKAYKKIVDLAVSKNWLPFTYKDGDVIIKEKSNWYIEIQGQLHITGRNLCYLVVWLGTEFIIKKVAVDHSFWNNKIKKKLEFFFKEAMLKELANSRRARKMDLRKYDPQKNQFV